MFRELAWGLVALGFTTALIGTILVLRLLGRRRNWRHEPAMVIGYEWRGSDDSTQHWILERTDTNGRVVRSVTTIGATWGTLRRFPFETMVLVNPNDEADFQLASGVRSGFGAWLWWLAE